jgi:hypothetical protein
MLQSEENFHDDVKYVLVFSTLTRMMLQNMHKSPFGKKHFKTLIEGSFSMYSQLIHKEKLLYEHLPVVAAFREKWLSKDHELESEFVNSIADVCHHIMTHCTNQNLHETIAAITSSQVRKEQMRKVWNAAQQKGGNFDDWYNNNSTAEHSE